ncbi:hypothetical protein [Sporosarcina koreensis]|uniref:hypothetical protein n=1 Tax=Bacillales TaxID=1385 RepID=UPI00075910A3|nr:hypothetical protein [Sporosarcina koreensis]
MKRFARVMFLSCLMFLAGCNSISKYEDDDVAAIVRGEEITVGELRFLYADDQVLDNLDGMIKATLAVQEAKRLNLDVSDKLQEIQETKSSAVELYPKDDDSEMAKELRQFPESQAKKLNMNPEEYIVKHYEIMNEISAYMVAYIEEKLGQSFESVEVDDVEEFDKKINQLLDKLVDDHKDEIEKFIK